MKFHATLIALVSVFVFFGQGVAAGFFNDILNDVGNFISGIFGNYNNGGSGITPPSQPNGSDDDDDYCDETTAPGTTAAPTTTAPPINTVTPTTTASPGTTTSPGTTVAPTTTAGNPTTSDCDDESTATAPPSSSGSSSGGFLNDLWNQITGFFGWKKREEPVEEGFTIPPEIVKRASGASSNKIAIEVALGAIGVAALLI